MRTKAVASDFVARRMLAHCLHTLRRIGSRADRPLSRSLTCRPRASLPGSCRSFGPLDSRIEGSYQRPSCCSVRNSCVPAILSVRMHMHRSSKIMLFCVDWGGGGAAGLVQLSPRRHAHVSLASDVGAVCRSNNPRIMIAPSFHAGYKKKLPVAWQDEVIAQLLSHRSCNARLLVQLSPRRCLAE